MRLRSLLREAVAVEDAPTVVRYPKGAVAEELPEIGRVGTMDLLRRPADGGLSKDLLIVGVGTMAQVACEVADRMADQGIGVTVIDPAPAAARHLLNVMKDNGLVHRDGQPKQIGDPKAADVRLFSSGPRAALERIFSIL